MTNPYGQVFTIDIQILIVLSQKRIGACLDAFLDSGFECVHFAGAPDALPLELEYMIVIERIHAKYFWAEVASHFEQLFKCVGFLEIEYFAILDRHWYFLLVEELNGETDSCCCGHATDYL